jgi:endonuclease/exonuclease/phosphatase family metal-dependent hydrolase
MDGLQVGPAFREFLASTGPTFVGFQESNLTTEQMPKGWTVIGEGSNKIATRLPVRSDGSMNFQTLGVGGRVDRFLLDTPDGQITIVNAHLPTVRPGIEAALSTKFVDLAELSRIIQLRTTASREARSWVGQMDLKTIVVGDFNMPVESRIYQEDWSDFRNAYSQIGIGWGTTKQTNWFGIRIDHILYPPSWECRKTWVGPAMGSDHRPMIAELYLDIE